MRRITIILTLTLTLFSIHCFAQNRSRINVITEKLGENLYFITTNAGGNLCIYVGEDGIYLVDSDYEQLFEKVKAAIDKVSDKPVKYLINTHWHFDHVGGNVKFKESGAVIIAHTNVRKRMATEQTIGILNTKVPASPKKALPMITYDKSVTFHENGQEIKVFHIADAHTDGDSVIHFKDANVIHMGDIFFNPGYPFVDVTNGGSINGMITAVEDILMICDDKTKIIPGHGPIGDKASLEAYWIVLRKSRDIVAALMDQGKSLDQIIQADPLAEIVKKNKLGIFPSDKFIEMVFRSLEKK